MIRSRSLAYARIRAEVLAAASLVPEGRVTTYASIAAIVGVTPRQVAYLLATLRGDERDLVPWHRVVGDAGRLGAGTPMRARAQREALVAEGVAVTPGSPRMPGEVARFERCVWNEFRPEGEGPRRYADPNARARFPSSHAFGYPAAGSERERPNARKAEARG